MFDLIPFESLPAHWFTALLPWCCGEGCETCVPKGTLSLWDHRCRTDRPTRKGSALDASIKESSVDCKSTIGTFEVKDIKGIYYSTACINAIQAGHSFLSHSREIAEK